MKTQQNQSQGYDIDGYEYITTALLSLLNNYPGLLEGDSIKFGNPDEDNGKAMIPVSGGIIVSEKKDIMGTVTQVCNYPFYVVYRSGAMSDHMQINTKEWLDNLGRWLERQSINIDNVKYKLTGYPDLTGNRKIKRIERQSPAFLETYQDGQIENWSIFISAEYENVFTI